MKLSISRFLIVNIVLFIVLFWASPSSAVAQELISPPKPTLHSAILTEQLDSQITTYPDGTQTNVITFAVYLTDLKKTVPIKVERLVEDTIAPYQVGDRVVVTSDTFFSEEPLYTITDHQRQPTLLLLAAVFIVLVVTISGGHGIRALLGLVSSFVVIFWFLLPFLEKGWNPIAVAAIASAFIISISFYISHGFSVKTTVAALGTFLSLIATSLLAQLFINISKLSGFGSEEMAFLQTIKGSDFNVQGLLLAGIILSTLGVLDDITISQASVVQELVHSSPKLNARELFQKAMNVGKDHIGSLVNTLVLVYAGSSLPLLLLFLDNRYSLWELINFEIVAQEIVITLVASIGLVLAVPITTALAVQQRNLLAKDAPPSSTAHHH
jgi:uncharacterized membrane protein